MADKGERRWERGVELMSAKQSEYPKISEIAYLFNAKILQYAQQLLQSARKMGKIFSSHCLLRVKTPVWRHPLNKGVLWILTDLNYCINKKDLSKDLASDSADGKQALDKNKDEKEE